MSELVVEFAFEIGDVVYARNATHDRDHSPKQYIVTERLAQQCHTDVQRLYKVFPMTEWIPEIVLTKEKPPYEKVEREKIAEELSLATHFAFTKEEEAK